MMPSAMVPAVLGEQDLQALRSADLQDIQRLLQNQELWTEVSLLERLVYKNRSQHRGTPYFKGLLEVRRHMKLLHELGLGQLIASLESKTRSATRSHAVADLPSRQDMALVLYRLMASCQVVEQLLPAIRRAASRFSGQLAESYFMPLSLTAVACLSRINALLILQATEAAKAYNLLVELLPVYPLASAWSPTAQQICDTAPDRQLPNMLKCTWDQGLLKLQKLVFDEEGMRSLLHPCMGGDIGAVLARGEQIMKRGRSGPDGDDLLPVFIDRGPASAPEHVGEDIQYSRGMAALPLLGSWTTGKAEGGTSRADANDVQDGPAVRTEHNGDSDGPQETQQPSPGPSTAPMDISGSESGMERPAEQEAGQVPLPEIQHPLTRGSPVPVAPWKRSADANEVAGREGPEHSPREPPEASEPRSPAGAAAAEEPPLSQPEKRGQTPRLAKPKKARRNPDPGGVGDIFAALLE